MHIIVRTCYYTSVYVEINTSSYDSYARMHIITRLFISILYTPTKRPETKRYRSDESVATTDLNGYRLRRRRRRDRSLLLRRRLLRPRHCGRRGSANVAVAAAADASYGGSRPATRQWRLSTATTCCKKSVVAADPRRRRRRRSS